MSERTDCEKCERELKKCDKRCAELREKAEATGWPTRLIKRLDYWARKYNLIVNRQAGHAHLKKARL